MDPDTTLDPDDLRVALTLEVAAAAGPTEPAKDEAGAPKSYLDRFELVRLIGEGGMGRVWQARDPRLGRTVAIKRLHAPDPLARRRFLREARLQASLEHPGICPVYEVGQAEGMPYIVMPLLAGRPLQLAAEGMAIEQKLVLIRRVAEAVHTAHGHGLIHRDLKPSNILVESPEQGPPRPVVLDFGIARPLGESLTVGEGPSAEEGLTVTGAVVGTPAYMAPEQARGELEQLDRRTDVYGLGATLYRLLAGRPPHDGSGGTLLMRILRDEPTRLRTAGIPADVEAMVFRCLEKDRERRYASALDLAEDLDRYLRGEPVRARRITLRIRLGKWLRRHRAPVRVAAVAALLLLLALGWGGWSVWKSEERQRLARQFGAQVEEIEALARYSRLVPLHDVRPDQAELRRRLDSIRPFLNDPDPTVRVLADHALGRGHLALGEPEIAREHLEAARALNPDDPELAVDLGRALSELYREELTKLDRLRDRGASNSLRAQLQQRLDRAFAGTAEAWKQAQQTLGEPARDLLEQVEQLGNLAPDRDKTFLLEVLRLFHQGRPAEALEHLERAPDGPSWDYEGLRLEGDIRRSWAIVLEAENGEDDDGVTGPERARHQLELARRAYADALAVAESHDALLRDDAQAVALLVRLDLVEPEEVEPLIDEGRERLRRARLANQDSVRTWLWTARLETVAAQHAADHRARDPGVHLEAAREAGERALELAPEAATVAYELGRTHWLLARRASEQGEDPEPHFERAEVAFARVAAEDRDYAYFTSLGSLRLAMAGRRAQRGLDAADAYSAAIEAYRRAAERHSAPFAALVNLGLALYNASSLPGSSALQMLSRAIESFEKARELNPDHMAPHYYLGLAHLRLAQGGKQASATLDDERAERAAADLERAAELSPERFQPWVGLGELHHLRALDAHARGRDPAAHFAHAHEAHAQALELAPDQPVALLNLAWTAYFEGKFALRGRIEQDQGPLDLLDEAAELCRRSLELRRQPSSLLCLGSVRRLQAELRVDRGRLPEAADLIVEARSLFEAMLELDANHAEAHRSLGRLFTLEARRQRLAGADPSAALERARQALDRALELEPEVIFFHLADARWQLEWADASALEAARERLERAAAVIPDSPELTRLQDQLEDRLRGRQRELSRRPRLDR